MGCNENNPGEFSQQGSDSKRANAADAWASVGEGVEARYPDQTSSATEKTPRPGSLLPIVTDESKIAIARMIGAEGDAGFYSDRIARIKETQPVLNRLMYALTQAAKSGEWPPEEIAERAVALTCAFIDEELRRGKVVENN